MMCKWGTDVELLVPIPASCSYTGAFRWAKKAVDRCIAPYVKALNDAGLYTGGCCCGHGEYDGFIGLHDGTILTITKIDPKDAICVKSDVTNEQVTRTSSI